MASCVLWCAVMKRDRILCLAVLTAPLLAAVAAGCSSDPAASSADEGAIGAETKGGWTAAEREEFSHLAMGNETTPLAWLKALENDDGSSFVESLGRFGFLADKDSPSGLPVGIAVTNRAGVDYFGVTCAGCHIREVSYQGKTLRIDGAPNMLSPEAFSRALVGGVVATVSDPARLGRFAAKAMPGVPVAAVADALKTYLGRVAELKKILPDGTPPGPGRSDSTTRASNIVFGAMDAQNVRTPVAPVAFMDLWGIEKRSWVQWTGDTNSVFERNMTAAFTSTGRTDIILPENLHRLERLTYKLDAPAWPATFGALDASRVSAGKRIFADRCASCHESKIVNGVEDVHMSSLAEVGTDPGASTVWGLQVKGYKGQPDQPMPVAVADYIKTAKADLFAKYKISDEKAREFENGRTPVWRDMSAETGKAYPARSLAGVWATAPYLHNDSVPTLEDLLKPASERPKSFPVGHTEYDPAKVGYRTDVPPIVTDAKGATTFDVTLAGNSNQGHEGPQFGTDLGKEDRAALLEYLKSR